MHVRLYDRRVPFCATLATFHSSHLLANWLVENLASLVFFTRRLFIVQIQTFSVEPVTYEDLCDGTFLNDVMQQM